MAYQKGMKKHPGKTGRIRRPGRFVLGAGLGVIAAIGWVVSTLHQVPSAKAALANPATYSPSSPHWAHINMLDFGRAAPRDWKPNHSQPSLRLADESCGYDGDVNG